MELLAALSWREWVAALGVIIGIVTRLDYCIALWRGMLRPHLFTWLVWSLVAGITATAQAAEGAGAGNWATILLAVFCVYVTIVAWRQGDKDIAAIDYICLFAALASIPLWYITQNPLWSVIWLCVIDCLGFIPTFRQSWNKPNADRASFFLLSNIPFMLGLIALERISLSTVLYPFVIILTNTAYAAMLLLRRLQLGKIRS